MNKAITTFKYTSATIIFVIAYTLCSIFAHFIVYLANFDAQGFWTYFLPYFSAFMAGILSITGAISIVVYLMPTIKLRFISWIFVCILGVLWLPPLIGLSLGLIGIIDAPIQSHVLWSPNTPPMIVQSLTASITAFKMTET